MKRATSGKCFERETVYNTENPTETCLGFANPLNPFHRVSEILSINPLFKHHTNIKPHEYSISVRTKFMDMKSLFELSVQEVSTWSFRVSRRFRGVFSRLTLTFPKSEFSLPQHLIIPVPPLPRSSCFSLSLDLRCVEFFYRDHYSRSKKSCSSNKKITSSSPFLHHTDSPQSHTYTVAKK